MRRCHLQPLRVAVAIFFVLVVTLTAGPSQAEALRARLVPAYPDWTALGPAQAKGAVIWSHGRSITTEDSLSPTPYYMAALRRAGWDTFRFNRMRDGDTLQTSATALVKEAARLKAAGYRKIVLAGQSFGAFLSLIAAGESDDIHAVVATAPAAYGSFEDFHESWQRNATRLYPILESVRNARVMLFYFHGDDFDPGGRGTQSEAILSARKLDHLIVDQPANLTSHWASSTGLFVRRFGNCIRDFVEAEQPGTVGCDESWGREPSRELLIPANWPSSSVQQVAMTETPDSLFTGTWYGYYPNGREVLLSVEKQQGKTVNALYAVGPALQSAGRAECMRRVGQAKGYEIDFREPGFSSLRFRLRSRREMDATWVSADGKITLEARLKRTDWSPEQRIITAAGGETRKR